MSLEQTGIFEACRQGNVELVEKLYAANPEIINAEDHKGFTPLILAVYNNQPQIVDFLLKKGAKLEPGDMAGNTALMGVCFKGYKEVAEQLLEAGADVNQRNSNGATALTFAATFGHQEIAEMLLKNGADINIPDARGKTPLDHARIQENWNMVDLIEQYQ
ncbi:MAG: ankyrin repeat protein [Segetibacter sp.]|nr:ankyrin repeat protein [Segetibacter sp.]